MSIVKIIEVMAESTVSFDDAAKVGVAKAAETVKNIKAAWVKEQKAIVEDGKITKFRTLLKISFVVD